MPLTVPLLVPLAVPVLARSLLCITNQGNTPWVAPACADCLGFPVLGSAPAPAATMVSEPQIVSLG